MTLKEVDGLVRESARSVLGNETLQARYITALNMLRVASRGMSPGMLRLKPEEVKAGKQQIREPL